MNILVTTPFFYPHIGGSQQYALELHSNLINLYPDIEVDVVCYNTDNAPAFEKYQGINIYRVPCINLLPGQFSLPNYLVLFALIYRLFKKNKYSLVNAHTRFFDNSWWTPVMAKIFGAKSLLIDHCADHPVHHNKVINFISNIIDKYVSAFFAKRYDFVFATNQSTQAFLTKLGMRNVQVLHGGVDTLAFDLPHFKDVASDLINITFVGRMIKSKRPQTLLAVAKNMVMGKQNIIFNFVGSGELLPQLQNSANHARIKFLGVKNKKEIAEILSQTDIFVHPSTHNEGFPNAILEAGAAGCAVVATDMGGTKEIIKNGYTGLLCGADTESLTAALEKMINDSQKRKELGGNIRNYVKNHFDWEVIAKKYQSFLKTV